jgi:hypothetical protein
MSHKRTRYEVRNETEVVKYSSHYWGSILSPYVILYVSLIFQFLLQPRVRTFESFEIFTEVYSRIPFVLGVMHRLLEKLVLACCLHLPSFKVCKDCSWTLLGILQESWTLDNADDEPEMFLKNSENHLLCSTVSHFRRMKSLSTFRIRGLTLPYYFLQMVSVIGFTQSLLTHDGPRS